MFRGKKVAVVVPAHNEEQLIGQALDQIPEYIDHVLVVDDASSDHTAQKVEAVRSRSGFRYIRHNTNRGVGGSIVTGYRQSIKQDVDIVAVMAGDAQMDPRDLPRLLDPVVEGRADYVKGDRLCWPGVFAEMPLTRFLGNHILSQITRLTSGYGEVRDSQCGYTAVSAKVLSRIDLDRLYQRYGFPNDILAHLHSAGARLAQVPVRPIYGREKSGISIYTACVEVPRVLFRSYLQRLSREDSPVGVIAQGQTVPIPVPYKRR